jgi:drug/metabolite transporter (DMT)-like permease
MVKDLTKHPKALVLSAFAAVYLIWGSTYLAIFMAIKTIPPFFMAGGRFLIAGLILLAYALIKGEQIPDIKSVWKISLAGILMLTIGNAFLAWTEQYLPSGLAAILVATVPLWFVLLDKKQWKFYFSNKQIIIGLIIGFIGVALLTNFNHTESLDPTHAVKRTIAILVLIAGGVAWTSGSLISKYKPTGHSLLMITAIQLIVSGFFCLFISIFSGESDHFYFPQVHRSAWLGFLYLAIFGSILTYICYLWLLKVRPAAQVSSYVYVNPVVAILLGAVIGKEPITILHLVSLGIILCGVLLINLPKYKMPRPKKIKLKYEEYCT